MLHWAFMIVVNFSPFLSSSQQPLSQFQPNLVQSILEWREFKFVQMKGRVFSQGEINTKYSKYNDEI